MSTQTKYINVSGQVTLIFTLDVELHGEYDSEEECEAMLKEQAFHDIRTGACPFPDEANIEVFGFETKEEESGYQDE